jgi:FMN-dependent NADH-azoreductase
MSKLLQINSSVFSAGGQSTQLANHFVESWRKSHPGASVTVRDLSHEHIPHLDGARVGAFFTPADQRDDAQKAVVAYSDALIAEIQAADTVVLGVPMYNFGIPSQLKSYFDHIARAGVTFKYTENGPVGLLTGKKAVVFTTRGGYYANTPNDTETSYLRLFLGFLGITEVNFVYAEGLNIGEDKKQAALEQARKTIDQIAA